MKKLYILIYFIISAFGSAALASQNTINSRFLAKVQARFDKEKNDKEQATLLSEQLPVALTAEKKCAQTLIQLLDNIIVNLSLTILYSSKFENAKYRHQSLIHAISAQIITQTLEIFLSDENNAFLLKSMDAEVQQQFKNKNTRLTELKTKLQALLEKIKLSDTNDSEETTIKDFTDAINAIFQSLEHYGIISEDNSSC